MMATEPKPKPAQPSLLHDDVDLMSCIDAFLELDRKVALMAKEMRDQAQELLTLSHHHMTPRRPDLSISDIMAGLNELMLAHRHQASAVDPEPSTGNEAWDHGFLEAWAIAARFIYLLQPQFERERDDGLEEAANWHENRADRHRRHIGSQTNALRHEYYASQIRSLKGGGVHAQMTDESTLGRRPGDGGSATSILIRRGCEIGDVNAELSSKEDSQKNDKRQ